MLRKLFATYTEHLFNRTHQVKNRQIERELCVYVSFISSEDHEDGLNSAVTEKSFSYWNGHEPMVIRCSSQCRVAEWHPYVMSLFSNNNFCYRICVFVSVPVFLDVVIFENVQYIYSRDMKIKMISAKLYHPCSSINWIWKFSLQVPSSYRICVDTVRAER